MPDASVGLSAKPFLCCTYFVALLDYLDYMALCRMGHRLYSHSFVCKRYNGQALITLMLISSLVCYVCILSHVFMFPLQCYGALILSSCLCYIVWP
jgi:hypothetical protein